MAEISYPGRFVAVWWVKENKYSTGTAKSLLGSHSQNLKPGDSTKGNYGRQKFDAVIMKFSDDENQLKAEGPDLLSKFERSSSPWINTDDSADDKLDDMEEEEDIPQIQPPRKRKRQNADTDEANKVRKELLFEKKSREAARQAANTEATVELMVSQRSSQLEEKVASLERTVAELVTANDAMTAAVTAMRNDMAGILQWASCRSCIKTHLKSSSSRTPDTRTSTIIASSPPVPVLPAMSAESTLDPPPFTAPSPCSVLPHLEGPHNTDGGEINTHSASQRDNASSSCSQPEEPASPDDLSYLGDAQYGVKLRTEDLRRCENSSSSGEKLALSLLEFLVTQEECRDMSVYGQAKGKSALDPKKRRALQSHIFARFYQDKTKDEKDNIWMSKIVYKLNDKIRGIKNGKYKLLSVL